MSTLRRRTRDSSWQWMLIGIILGVAFSAVACLAAYAAGLITLNAGGGEPVAEELAPPTVLVSEVAELPTPTPTREQQVIVVTATPAGVTVIQPSATPVLPTATPVQEEAATEEGTPSEGTAAPTEAALIGTPLATPTVTAVGGIDPALASISTAMNLVSGGDFMMGTNQAEAAAAVSICVNEHAGNCLIAYAEDSFPPHRVIVDSFQMEITEVTVSQYVAFLNSLGPGSHLNGCFDQPCAATRAEAETSNIEYDGTTYAVSDLFTNLPMTHVTWYGARAYCEAIGRRLPTEAEWERAARDADGRIYPWGNEWDETRARTSRPQNDGPVQVGSYPAGASFYGILDLAGNVAEWVQDWYDPGYYARPEASGLNPQGPPAGTTKVVRGGSWDAVPFFARSVHRQEFDPNTQTLFIGFRCVSDDVPVQPGSAAPGEQPGGVLASPTAVLPPTQDPNITPSPLPSLPPGG